LADISIKRTFTISTLQQKNADNYKNSDRVEISKTALTQNDLKNIRQILNENSLQSQLNDLILNLSKSSNEILNKKNSKELITIANNNLASLFDCYIKNKCGVNESILKIMISRHLELIKVALKNDIKMSPAVNWIVIRECSGINNNDVRILTADLLFNYDTKNNGNIKILDIASSYSGQAKADFFKTISEALLPAERKLFISALKESFLKDDSKTIELIVLNLNEMSLKKTEVSDLGNSLCHLKTKENWNNIKLAMSSVSTGFEKTCL
jgi:hypothetical protein